MILMKQTLLSLILCLTVLNLNAQALPKPTPRQLAWQQWETTAFLHFTVNTYTDKEWGDGTESPSIFNPTEFDAKKIVATLKEAGFRLAILTAKHHDGFCLWQTQQTEHSIKNSPYKGGKGDIVGEMAAACKAAGLKFGVYLSPWDRHEASYGTPQYNDFYKKQLRELLTNYGDIYEVWFDGAKGDNAKNMEYDFKGYWDMVRDLQPEAVMFSDAGPDVRWVGNESGNAGETCWSTLNTEGLAPGKADEKYLNTGDSKGAQWVPAETDVSIRPGWFYHEKENNKVKSPKELVNLYYKSVGRNSLLLLNIPPNKKGLIENKDAENIIEFRSILDETFEKNFAKGIVDKALTDKKLATNLLVFKPLIIDFKKEIMIDRALIQENIAEGQRIEKAKIEYWNGKKWLLLEEFTTIGYKRLLRFDAIKTSKVRFTVVSTKAPVLLSEIGFFKASNRE
jgi:alpha-L-fucosidase